MKSVSIPLNTNSLDDYRRFLAIRRSPVYHFAGSVAKVPSEYAAAIDGTARKVRNNGSYHPSSFLFDYQAAIAGLAIRKRKFATFVECGLGKTLILLEFAKHCQSVIGRKNVLIVSPLMVVPQTIAEAERFYPGIGIQQVSAANLQEWLDNGTGIGITNYEAIKAGLTAGRLGGLVLDECFAPGTKVLCIGKNGISVNKDIENILCGDKIYNASGVDTVIKTKRREVEYAVAVTAGERITCSPNHPFFTQRGWVCAQDLEPGDAIAQTEEAVRMVRGTVPSAHLGRRLATVLRSILLSELADEPADSCCESSHCGDACENRESEVPVSSGNKTWATTGQEICGYQTDVDSRSSGAGQQDTKGHEAQTFRAWWERDAIAATAQDFDGCVVRELEGGICCVSGPTTAGISHKLQARFGKPGIENRNRGGWNIASVSSESGQEKRRYAGFIGVESIEILEQGNPELEKHRNADGKLYFYDLEAERHPSYSVADLLVHNSSMLKSHYGHFGTRLLKLGAGLDWKLCLTGTPAPNDRIEYANHAVFLGACRTVNEFLARYFVNRGQTQERWEMKPHALSAFYRDLSHWCIFVTNPGAYGWKDNAGTIPPINVHIHRVEMSGDQIKAVQKVTGGLMAGDIGGIGQRSKLGQIAKGFYNGKAIETAKPEFIRGLVESWPDESAIVWCLYNEEQKSNLRVMPDAANITGDTPLAERVKLIDAFKSGERRVLQSKPKILGFGLNLQVATRQIFSGLQDSYESYWQAVKRSNRVGSDKPLNVHIPITDVEEPMVQNVLRKAAMVEADTAEQQRMFLENAWKTL